MATSLNGFLDLVRLGTPLRVLDLQRFLGRGLLDQCSLGLGVTLCLVFKDTAGGKQGIAKLAREEFFTLFGRLLTHGGSHRFGLIAVVGLGLVLDLRQVREGLLGFESDAAHDGALLVVHLKRGVLCDSHFQRFARLAALLVDFEAVGQEGAQAVLAWDERLGVELGKCVFVVGNHHRSFVLHLT